MRGQRSTRRTNPRKTHPPARKLRRGDNTSELTAKTYDDGYAFMLLEIEGDNLHFQAINERGVTVDKGVVHRDAATNKFIGTGATPARPPARR